MELTGLNGMPEMTNKIPHVALVRFVTVAIERKSPEPAHLHLQFELGRALSIWLVETDAQPKQPDV